MKDLIEQIRLKTGCSTCTAEKILHFCKQSVLDEVIEVVNKTPMPRYALKAIEALKKPPQTDKEQGNMKDKVNNYCISIIYPEAEIISVHDGEYNLRFKPVGDEKYHTSIDLYNPYDDLNQMAEVAENLIRKLPVTSNTCTMVNQPRILEQLYYSITGGVTIKQAFRDFIISTMEET